MLFFKKSLVLTIAAVFVGAGLWSQTLADQQPDDIPATVLIDGDAGHQMRAKLHRSKRILEGLIGHDFAVVSRSARELKRIGQATDWPQQGDELFERYRRDFAAQCDDLDRLAKQSNHAGAEFTFLSMTVTCIRCHDHLRDTLAEHTRARNGDVRFVPRRSALSD